MGTAERRKIILSQLQSDCQVFCGGYDIVFGGTSFGGTSDRGAVMPQADPSLLREWEKGEALQPQVMWKGRRELSVGRNEVILPDRENPNRKKHLLVLDYFCFAFDPLGGEESSNKLLFLTCFGLFFGLCDSRI